MSPAFSLLSHNTWQQTLNVALLPILLLLIKEEKTWTQVLFGFLLVLFLFNRPTNVFFLPILFLGNWRNFVYWTSGGILPLAFFFYLHTTIYSHPLGGYYYHSKMIGGSSVYISITLQNILGVFFSPARGLFVYQPYLLIVLLISPILRKEKTFWIYLFILASFFMFYGNYLGWKNNWSYGSRFFSDLTPIFLILTIAVWKRF